MSGAVQSLWSKFLRKHHMADAVLSSSAFQILQKSRSAHVISAVNSILSNHHLLLFPTLKQSSRTRFHVCRFCLSLAAYIPKISSTQLYAWRVSVSIVKTSFLSLNVSSGAGLRHPAYFNIHNSTQSCSLPLFLSFSAIRIPQNCNHWAAHWVPFCFSFLECISSVSSSASDQIRLPPATIFSFSQSTLSVLFKMDTKYLHVCRASFQACISALSKDSVSFSKVNIVCSFESISTSLYGPALLSLSRYGMKVSKIPILALYVWCDSVSLNLWIHQIKNKHHSCLVSFCLLLLYPNYELKQLMFAKLLSCCGIRVSKTSRQSSHSRCGSISLLYLECPKGFQPRPMSRGSLSPFGLCMQKRRTVTCVWGYIFTSSCCNS